MESESYDKDVDVKCVLVGFAESCLKLRWTKCC